MNTTILTIFGIALGLIIFFTLLRFILKKVTSSMKDLISEQFQEEDIIMQEAMANFFGQESRGAGQMRGNGALILTNDALHFTLLLPRRSWVIPLENITEMSLPRKHLGKSKMCDLLRVDYLDNTDNEKGDAIAWAVKDPESWIEAISKQKEYLDSQTHFD